MRAMPRAFRRPQVPVTGAPAGPASRHHRILQAPAASRAWRAPTGVGDTREGAPPYNAQPTAAVRTNTA